jgi:hypothetical protein
MASNHFGSQRCHVVRLLWLFDRLSRPIIPPNSQSNVFIATQSWVAPEMPEQFKSVAEVGHRHRHGERPNSLRTRPSIEHMPSGSTVALQDVM